MTVAYSLLGLLGREPRHGYELKREYDAVLAHARPLLFGQLSSTLTLLERDGRVALGGEEPGKGPERKRPVITDEGATDLNARETPEPFLQPSLFIKVALALQSGRDAAGILDRQRRAHLLRMRELTAVKQAGTDVDRLLADHALFHLEADLRWIDLAESRLMHLKEGRP